MSQTVLEAVAAPISGIVGVSVGAFLNYFKDLFFDKRKQKQQARYLAIRVTCIIDEFIERCVELVRDDGLNHGQRNTQDYLTPQVRESDGIIFPDDLDWKSINPDLMYNILSLPNKIQSSNRTIEKARMDAFPPDFEEYFESRQYEYGELGLIAIDISNTLRKKYKIPERGVSEMHDILYLEARKPDIEQKRSVYIENIALSAASILARTANQKA